MSSDETWEISCADAVSDKKPLRSVDLPQPIGPVIAVNESRAKQISRREIIGGEAASHPKATFLTWIAGECREPWNGSFESSSGLFSRIWFSPGSLELLVAIKMGLSSSWRNFCILSKLPTACSPSGIAKRSCLAGVTIRLRMEREATVFVTDNGLSCDTSLTTEYAPKVMRGDKTAGEKAADVSTCLPGVKGVWYKLWVRDNCWIWTSGTIVIRPFVSFEWLPPCSERVQEAWRNA